MTSWRRREYCAWYSAPWNMHSFSFFFSLQRYGLCFRCLRLSYCVFCLLSNFSDCNCLQTPTLTLLLFLGAVARALRLFSVGRTFASEKELGVCFLSIKLLSDVVWQGQDKNPFPHPVGPEFDKLRDLILIFQLTLSVKSCPLGH